MNIIITVNDKRTIKRRIMIVKLETLSETQTLKDVSDQWLHSASSTGMANKKWQSINSYNLVLDGDASYENEKMTFYYM